MSTRPPGRPPKSGTTFSVRIEIRATEEERAQLDRAAEISGLERSDWIRKTLNLVAGQTIQEHDENSNRKKKKVTKVLEKPAD